MKTKDGYTYEILRTSKALGMPKLGNYVYIRYEDGEITTVGRQSAKEETFYRFKPKLYGIGINDADSDSSLEILEKWRRMLARCVAVERGYTCSQSDSVINSYVGVEVCEEWKTYSNFERWVITQDWEGKDLDKDLLGNGKLYSPDTCCFLPHILNSQICLQDKGLHGIHGVGFNSEKGKYYAVKYKRNKKIKKRHFNTKEEAHHCWQIFKAEVIDELVEEYFKRGEICNKIRTAFLEISNKLRKQSSLKEITTHL
jgi:hypothetical protein